MGDGCRSRAAVSPRLRPAAGHSADILCLANTLTGKNEAGTWKFVLHSWYAGYPPDWPDWLLD
jgi:hypothetical protein